MAGRKDKKILKTMVITALLNIVKTESVSSMLRKTVITIVFNNFFSFLPAVVLKCLSCSACILQMRVNLTSFIFKSKFISFPIYDSAHLLSHYYYYYNYYFYYYLFFFFSTCFVLLLYLVFIV